MERNGNESASYPQDESLARPFLKELHDFHDVSEEKHVHLSFLMGNLTDMEGCPA